MDERDARRAESIEPAGSTIPVDRRERRERPRAERAQAARDRRRERRGDRDSPADRDRRRGSREAPRRGEPLRREPRREDRSRRDRRPPDRRPRDRPRVERPRRERRGEGVREVHSRGERIEPRSSERAREYRERRRRAEPNTDVIDKPDEVIVLCDLPGCDAERIDLRADGNRLRIRAERDEQSREGRLHRNERPTQRERTVELPARAEIDEAEARYQDGVLKISLPKREDERERAIGIQ